MGAVADPLASAYGVSVAAIGLLTTALFLTHLAIQLPAGRGADRFGARTVAFLAIGAAVVGNGVLLVDDSFGPALVGRAIVGVGSGAGFVAGLDLVRAGGGGSVLQGVYGGATMAGGGLALMIVPSLTAATSWRAAYWSAAALALAAAFPTLLARDLPRIGHAGAWVIRDPELLPLGVLHAATFGLAIIAGNWVVPLLEREGASAAAAGFAGGLILFIGIVTRPRAEYWREAAGDELVAVSLAGTASGAALLALGGPFAVSALGALVMGLSAGLPFAVLFAAAQRVRPDAPAAAVALVNACAILTIVVGTPLAGLTFELPSDGRLAFATIAALSLSRRTLFAERACRGHNPLFHPARETHMALSFGVTVLPDPPSSRLVELFQLAESNGFEYGWTYDSHVLWQESFPLLTLAVQATTTMKFGHCVTNPGTREPTVLASGYATLHDISDGRMVDGHRPGRLRRPLHRRQARSRCRVRAACSR